MVCPLAVILGAGPGIGLAVARRFAREGFNLALVSRPTDPLPAFQAAPADGRHPREGQHRLGHVIPRVGLDQAAISFPFFPYETSWFSLT